MCLVAIFQNHYEKISGRKTPTYSHDQGEESEETGDKVTLYLLAHRFLSRNGQGVGECVMCVCVCLSCVFVCV